MNLGRIGHAALPAAHTPLWLAAALGDRLGAERDRWALWLPVAFGVGIALYFALPSEPALWSGAVTAGAAAGWALLRWPRGDALAAVAGAAVAAGFATATLHARLADAPMLERPLGYAAFDGRVIEVEARPESVRLLLDRVTIAGLPTAKIPERIRITMRRPPADIRPGDRVSGRASLMPPSPPAAPGAFDFARGAYFDRLGAVGYTLGSPRVDRPPAEAFAFGLRVADLRLALTARIRAAVGDAAAGAVAAALVTGDRAAIPPEVNDAMRDSGLAHLLSISGLHLSLVAGIVLVTLRTLLAAVEPLALRRPIKKWAAAGALAVAFAYLQLSGGSVPTQRAFLMVAIVLVAVMADRTAVSMRSIALAAMAVMVMAPESMAGPSFQMSFAAVVALVATYEAAQPRLTAWRRDGGALRRVWLYVAGTLLTTLVAGLATTPFGIYHFNRLQLYALAANLIAIPITGFWIMPFAVAAFALMPLGLDGWALAAMGWGVEAVIETAHIVASWPGAVWPVPAMPAWGLGLVALGGLWLCLWRGGWRLWGVPAIAAGIAGIAVTAPPDVLVDAGRRLLAVRGEDGSVVIAGRRKTDFDADTWTRRAGRDGAAAWPEAGAAAGGRLRCDPLGCVYETAGQVVAFATDPAALAEDCRRATVVVSFASVRRRACARPELIIDSGRLRREGTHALWLSRGGIRVETVAADRGDRPWSRRPSSVGTGRPAAPAP
ncbi:MAG: ComEC/Rec2 family competence protein [Rhodospirillales bacterium]